VALAPAWLASATARPPFLAATGEAAAVLLAGLALTMALARSVHRERSAPATVAHGSARFATPADLERADLLSGEGLVLGSHRTRFSDRPLTDRSADHALILMTTGGGKTSGPLVSTLLNGDEPALVVDPKAELWELTAGFRRSRGHTVVRFAPFDGATTCRWNPFDEIKRGLAETTTLGILTQNLITYPAEAHAENHWTASARSLLRCLALDVLYRSEAPSFAEVREQILSTPKGHDAFFRALASAPHDPKLREGWTTSAGTPTPTHPEVHRLATAMASTPERERGSIVSTLHRFLDLWGDPRVAAATSTSDWSLAWLAERRPVTVYVTAPTSHLALLGPLLRILISLLAFQLTDDDGPYRDVAVTSDNRLLLVLDEFASLGRMPILEDLLAFTRGYGVRTLLAVQDLAQLVRLYGRHHTFAATCRLHVAGATGDVSTRNEISRRVGEATFRYRKTAKSGSLLTTRRTVSHAEVRRPLLTEGEIGELDADQLLIVKAGHPPILAHRLPYWTDPRLARRAGWKPPKNPQHLLRASAAARLPSTPQAGAA